MTAAALVLPLGETCAACGRSTASHRVNGAWVGCSRDLVVGRDVATLHRRLLLARLQPRKHALKVQPWAVDVESQA